MKLRNQYLFDSILYIISICLLGIILPNLIFKNPNIFIYLIFITVIIIVLRIRTVRVVNKLVRKIFKDFMSAIEQADNIDLKSEDFKNFGSGLSTLESDAELFFDSYIKSIKSKDQLLHRLEDNNLLLNNLIHINNEMHKYSSVEEFYDYILNMAVKSIPNATHGSLMKLNKDNFLEFISLVGFEEVIKKTKIHLFKSVLWNETNGLFDRPVIVKNIVQYNENAFSKEQQKIYEEEISFNAVTSISTPILIGDTLFGMLNVDSAMENAFSQRDIDLMIFFAKQISITLNNRILLENTIHLSRYDSLTGIYNRGYFEEIVLGHVKKAKRYNEAFSLIIIDLDNLKVVNDNFGHKMGDQLIIDFTNIIKSNIRDSDIFGRYGGDEFILILFGFDKEVLENKLKELSKYALKYGKDKKRVYTIEFSYGIGVFPDDSDDFDHLVTIADENMYKLKKQKK